MDLWSSTRQLLASARFTNETASGWQQVIFSNPVHVTPNTTYVASYHSSTGDTSEEDYYFALGAGLDNPPLNAPADGNGGPNGVYAFGPAGTFPNNNFTSGGVALCGENGTSGEWNNLIVRKFATVDPTTELGTAQVHHFGHSPPCVAGSHMRHGERKKHPDRPNGLIEDHKGRCISPNDWTARKPAAGWETRRGDTGVDPGPASLGVLRGEQARACVVNDAPEIQERLEKTISGYSRVPQRDTIPRFASIPPRSPLQDRIRGFDAPA